jgi:hypothetical protein
MALLNGAPEHAKVEAPQGNTLAVIITILRGEESSQFRSVPHFNGTPFPLLE